jgi:cytochrome c-type biogenesis protein CcmF
MINIVGNTSLYLALLLSALQTFCFFKTEKKFIKRYKFFVSGLLIFSSIAFFSLMYGYFVSDFTILNVFKNSHSSKPLIYKIAATWGNHEGSMLLWILVLTIFNFLIFKLYNKQNLKYVYKALQIQGFIIFGFMLFTILTSNPFQNVESFQSEGWGFNPILQDPALAIHPPFLYIGYVGFSAAFSLAMATLISQAKIADVPWHQYIKTFVMIAWTFLTIGIALGSIWAYYELGWGGWWFWDPVENASFMPWLLGTALIHSLMIVDKTKSLQIWVLLLSILTFLLSVVGTFLVRSGILTSVHTFALDPSRGIYILTFMAILGGYSFILFFQKSKYFFSEKYFSFLSKEGSILFNNFLMVVVCATVFLGTIYPLIIEAILDNKISVGEPYFNKTIIPITIPAILLMGVAPIFAWKKDNLKRIIKISSPKIIVTIILTLSFLYFYKFINFIGIIGIFLAFWIISNNLLNLILKTKGCSKETILAHFGVGLLILGITSSSVWQEESVARMNVKDQVTIKNYTIVFNEINEIKGQNYVAIQGNFLVSSKKNKITNLKPEKRLYPVTNIITTEAAIHTNLVRDLYIVLGNGNSNDGWVVRFYINPLVIWIWIGVVFMFVGGILSIKKSLNKKIIIG